MNRIPEKYNDLPESSQKSIDLIQEILIYPLLSPWCRIFKGEKKWYQIVLPVPMRENQVLDFSISTIALIYQQDFLDYTLSRD